MRGERTERAQRQPQQGASCANEKISALESTTPVDPAAELINIGEPRAVEGSHGGGQ